MTGGFNDPIIAKGGGLAYPSIHSPNFVHNSAGWSINKDGSAEFNNLVVRNGQIISGTALYYSGTPGAGTLVLAISAANGSDAFGTPYYAGVATYVPSGGKSLVINLLSTAPATAGFFQYANPSGGVQGSLILSVTSAAGTDPVTSASYPAGLFGDDGFGDTLTTQGATIFFQASAWTRVAEINSFNAGTEPGFGPVYALTGPEQTPNQSPAHSVMSLFGSTSTKVTQVVFASATGSVGISPQTQAFFEVQSGGIDVAGNINRIIAGAEETWHSLGTLTGYTVTVGLYRLTALGDLELDIVVVAGGANAVATTFSVTLPAAYRPAHQKEIPAGTSANVASGVTQPRVVVTAAGAVTVQLAANSTATLYAGQALPLN